MNATGSVVGTHAGTDLIASTTTIEFPITVLDWQLKYIAGGTHSAKSLKLNTKLAGTGANVGIGTIALGTNVLGEVRDGALTETDLAAGDDLMITFQGTDAIVSDVVPIITYVERYVQSDS